MALVKQLENYKAAASSELRATSNRSILGLPATRSSTLVAFNEQGAEIAEAALVLPLVFMFLLGIVWFGRAFNIYSTITQAAQQGAVTAARASCSTCGSVFPAASTVADKVAAVLQASSVDPNQIILYQPNNLQGCTSVAVSCDCGSRNVCVCSSVLLNAATNSNQPPQCGTLVSFQYPFQFYLPFTSLNAQRIVLTAQAQSRMEQ